MLIETFSNLLEFTYLFDIPCLFQLDLLFVPHIYSSVLPQIHFSRNNWSLRDMPVAKYFCFYHINPKTMLHAHH